MNSIYLYILKFVKKLDLYVLINYPIIWSIKAHYFFFFSFLLGNILALILGSSFPVSTTSLELSYSDSSNDFYPYLYLIMERLITIAMIIISPIILYWVIYLHRVCPRIASIKKYNILILCCSSIVINFFLFQMVVSNKVAKLEKQESILQLEKIFLDSYSCKDFEHAIKFINVDDQIFHIKSNLSSSRVRVGLDSFLRCSKGALRYPSSSVVFLRNRIELNSFSNYVLKYNLLDNPDDAQIYSEQSDLEDFLHYQKNFTNDRNITFPIVFNDRRRVGYYAKPLLFIKNAKKGIFHLWSNWQQYTLWAFAFIAPSLIFLLLEFTILEILVSIFISTYLPSLLGLPIQSILDGQYFLSCLILLGFLVIGISLVKFVISKIPKGFHRIWPIIGFFIMVYVALFSINLIFYAFEEKFLLTILASVLFYLFITNIYFYMFVSRKNKFPNKT